MNTRKAAVLSGLALMVVLGLSLAAPALAEAQMQCDDSMNTIQSLRDCVQQCYDMGYIENKGVARALLSELNAAQAALDRGQPAVASADLQAFVKTVNAQAGVTIVQDHADHMVMHAQMVIQGLGG